MSDCEVDRSNVVEAGDMLDVYSAADLLAAIREAMSRAGGLTIDLGGSARIHTAALQLMVSAARACAESGRDFRLRGVSPEFAGLLRLTGLGMVVGFADMGHRRSIDGE